MIKKNNRQVLYVCSAIRENELLSESLPASSIEEASKLFEEQFKLKPKSILGPFLKKKVRVEPINNDIKFEGKARRAIYDGCLVNSFLLKQYVV